MSKIFSSVVFSFLILASAILFLTGCGPKSSGPTVKWAGTVTLEGQPLPADVVGKIIIQTGGGENQAGNTQGAIVDGKYSLDDVPQGPVFVRFNIIRQKPSTRPEDAGRGIVDSTDLTPKKWQHGVEDNADSNNLEKNFDLTKK